MVENVVKEPRALRLKERLFLVIFSLILVAFGQPSWFAFLAPLASLFGFALFFQATQIEGKKRRFFLGLSWFFGVQLVQLSWMTAIEYQGVYILIAYMLFSLGMGLQFGLFTLCVPPRGMITLPKVFALAGLWTIFEWSRLHFLCGFTWNPIGLSLAWSLPSIQMASLFGVFGLSFWVVLQNLLTLRIIRSFGAFEESLGQRLKKLLQPPLRSKLYGWCAVALSPISLVV